MKRGVCRISKNGGEIRHRLRIGGWKIEKTVHTGKNFTKNAMMMALIGIGVRNSKLEKLAIAAAKRIGKVEVDHGETNCETPNALEYIEKIKAWKKRKK